jgi:hypothetical protein
LFLSSGVDNGPGTRPAQETDGIVFLRAGFQCLHALAWSHLKSSNIVRRLPGEVNPIVLGVAFVDGLPGARSAILTDRYHRACTGCSNRPGQDAAARLLIDCPLNKTSPQNS